MLSARTANFTDHTQMGSIIGCARIIAASFGRAAPAYLKSYARLTVGRRRPRVRDRAPVGHAATVAGADFLTANLLQVHPRRAAGPTDAPDRG